MIYWTILFGHRMSSGRYQIIIGVPEGYRNPPGTNGPLWVLVGREEGPQGAGRAHPPLGPNWTRVRGRRPPFLPFPLFLPSSPSSLGGILLGLGVLVGLLPLGAPYRAGRPPLSSFIYRGRGTPKHNSCSLSRVRCPLHSLTPRSYRRSA